MKMIIKLLYVGFAVENVDRTRRIMRDMIGLHGEQVEEDPYLGTDKGARLAFPNECWLYVMESHQSDSPVASFLRDRGPGLERVALLSDDIESEFDRVRQAGVPIPASALASTPLGRRFTVPARHVSGVAVEVYESDPDAWVYDSPANINGVLGLQHIGLAVRDLAETREQFRRFFDLEAAGFRTDQHGGEQQDIMICPGNDRLWLHVTQSWGENARVRHYMDRTGEGLEHLCIEVYDIRRAVSRVTSAGSPLHEDKIFTNRPDGFEAFIYPEHTSGVTIELIEPYPFSRGYRPQKPAETVI